MEGHIWLSRDQFESNETLLTQVGELRASTFRYSSGVRALRLQSPVGHIVVLPYQGQQVWDAVFGGRQLTMKNFFPHPVSSGNLLDSYGAFLYHCGALRTGTPGPEDDHPLHGELPAAPYEEAKLVFGEDDRGRYLAVSGTFNYIRAFGDKYRATPTVKLREDSGVLDVSITIENLSHYPMDLMYMCHINFLPAANGEIIQATGWGVEDMVVRSQIPSHVKPTKKYLEFLDRLKQDPGVTRVVRPEDEYNPEVVFYLKNLKSDESGMTHLIQKHPDGTSDYVSYDAEALNHTVRWILKHQDHAVMGMALPATADPEGYSSEKKKGNVRTLEALESVTFSVRAGYLDGEQTDKIERVIKSL